MQSAYLVITKTTQPRSSLVEGEEGCIGPSGKLLCFDISNQNYDNIPFMLDWWANRAVHFILLKSTMTRLFIYPSNAILLRNLQIRIFFYFFKKIGPFPASFFFMFAFAKQLIVHINFADDWSRTADLWCRKRPLYQLGHNHFPKIFVSLSVCDNSIFCILSSKKLTKMKQFQFRKLFSSNRDSREFEKSGVRFSPQTTKH